MTVGDRIKRYLRMNNIKQRVLARAMYMSESSLSTKLSDNRKLGLDEYIFICQYLKLDFNYFIHQEDWNVPYRKQNGR